MRKNSFFYEFIKYNGKNKTLEMNEILDDLDVAINFKNRLMIGNFYNEIHIVQKINK